MENSLLEHLAVETVTSGGLADFDNQSPAKVAPRLRSVLPQTPHVAAVARLA